MSKFKVKKLPKNSYSTPKVEPKNDDLPEKVTDLPKKKIRKVVLILLVLITGIFGITYAMHSIGSIKVGTADNGGSIFERIHFLDQSGSAIEAKKWTTNLLILGIGGAGHQAGELADSIMLASLDSDRKSVTMISVPRDLFVAYPEKMGAGKINALYPMGLHNKEWVNWIAEKVSEVTGQPIDHYIVIDFTAFRYVVNALGGVEINVEKDIYDREYPDYNYGYTIFSLKKGFQTLDGETALRYARSRHSTSDTDRSHRQQQLISAIKSKALSLGIISNPTKIAEIIDATRKNINTDLTVADIVELGGTFSSVEKENIHMYNLGSNCIAYNNCEIGSYLYQPSMAYFGGAWAVIPEWAQMNRLSYYDNIRRFVKFVFEYPGINKREQPLLLVYNSKSQVYAKSVLTELKRIGINYNPSRVLKASTWAIEHSHINVYWNAEYKVGIDPESDIVKALKSLDDRIPINIVANNEYVTDDGPKIELVFWNDAKDYFVFSKSPAYLPKIESPAVSGEVNPTSSIIKSTSVAPSPKNSISPIQKPSTVSNPSDTSQKEPTAYKVAPGQWEEF